MELKTLGYINWKDYYLDIKVTKELIRKRTIEVMEKIEFYPESIKKRKTISTEEEIIQQICPNKRIDNKIHEREESKDVKIVKRNDGREYEKKLYSVMNNAGYKPIQTRPPDKNIDVIGEYKGITIYAQAKDWQNKVTTKEIQQLEGVILNKSQSIGVIVSKSGYTKDAVNCARASTVKILLTNMDTIIGIIEQAIEQMQVQKQSRIEIIGQSAEITQTIEKNVRRTVIRNAKKTVIYN